MATQAGKNMGKEKDMVTKIHNLKFLIIILFLFPFFLKGELTSKKKLLFFFDKIEVRGSVDVFLKKGKRLREVTIYADSSIIDNIQTSVSLKTLYIDANNTYSLARRIPFVRLKAERKYPVEIIVSVEKLKEIRLFENSNLTAEQLTSDNLKIVSESTGKFHLENSTASKIDVIQLGTGEVILKGKDTREIEIKNTGNGNLFASDLNTERATLIHLGTGNIHLAPTDWLDVRILNSGNLILHSKPKNLVIDQKGTGLVKDILPDAESFYEDKPTNQN